MGVGGSRQECHRRVGKEGTQLRETEGVYGRLNHNSSYGGYLHRSSPEGSVLGPRITLLLNHLNHNDLMEVVRFLRVQPASSDGLLGLMVGQVSLRSMGSFFF